MRGKPTEARETLLNRRITPADAGKTTRFLHSLSRTRDHPRGCGENAIPRTRISAKIGSPPRMRGKLFERYILGNWVGITPADAGKTLLRSCVIVGVEDHPRGCGENTLLKTYRSMQAGSPPRMRGKHRLPVNRKRDVGITPADAGKTILRVVADKPKGDHPRGCGENLLYHHCPYMSIGSPPRMRGKPMLSKQDLDAARITPADAGKTTQA